VEDQLKEIGRQDDLPQQALAQHSPMAPMHTPRRKKLVRPGYQLLLIWRFAGLAALAMLLQFGLMTFQLMRGTGSLGPDGAEPVSYTHLTLPTTLRV